MIMCAMEFKTRSANDQILALQQQILTYGQFKECDAGSLEFRSLVPDAGYRSQIVHHAAVLGVEYSCIVFSTTAEVEQAVLVRVSAQQRGDWLRLFKVLSEIHLSFAYGPSAPTSPPRIGPDFSKQYGYAGDHHTLETYVHLWYQHTSDVMQNGTPPACRRLLPLETTAWNKLMGGIDTVRKVTSGHKAERGPNSKPGSLLWSTLLDYTLYNAFRVFQYSMIESEFDRYSTHQKFQAARQAFTYVHFLSLLQEQVSYGAVDQAGLVFYERGNTEQPGMPTEAESLPPARKTLKKVKYKALEKFNAAPLKNLRLDQTKFHASVSKGKRSHCVYCCYYRSIGKDHTSRLGRTTRFMCSVCQVSLCKSCFSRFHADDVLQPTNCCGGLAPVAVPQTPAPAPLLTTRSHARREGPPRRMSP